MFYILMTKTQIIIIFVLIFISSIGAVDEFCDHKRKLLLAGVFNYEDIVFAYSWKEIKEFQQQIVWRFQLKDNKLTEIGTSLEVQQIFPGIPLFRAGFALKLKCDVEDTTCIKYKDLVFVFFQIRYKVFRFSNNRFSDLAKDEAIPWGLTSEGLAKTFAFGVGDIDNIIATAFVSGYQSQIFIVAKSTLYSSPVNIIAQTLHWTALTTKVEYKPILGAFVIGSDIYFNRMEGEDGLLMVHNKDGNDIQEQTIWQYFGCTASDDSPDNQMISKLGYKRSNAYHQMRAQQEEDNNRYAALIITGMIVSIIISNTSAAIFWLYVNKKSKKEMENI